MDEHVDIIATNQEFLSKDQKILLFWKDKRASIWGDEENRNFEPIFDKNENLILNRVKCVHCLKEVPCTRTDKLSNHIKKNHSSLLKQKDFPLMTKMEKKEATEKFVLSLVVENHPFELLQGLHSRAWLSKINPHWIPPTNETIHKHIDQIFIKMSSLVKEKLSSSTFLSQTSDSWKSRAKDHYIIVNVHLIEDFVPVSFTLGACIVDTMHTSGKDIANTNKQLYNEYNISKCTIVETTDGGSNFVEASRILNHERLHCTDHVINLIVREMLLEVSPLISKASKLVQKFNQSSPCLKKLHLAQLQLDSETTVYSLKQENDTRWNSTLNMIERMMKLREAIDVAIKMIKSDSLIKIKPEILTEHEWSMFSTLIEFLLPFRVATKHFESKSNAGIASLIPVVRNLVKFCENFEVPKSTDECSYLDFEVMKEIAINRLKERFDSIPTTFLVPSFLHPCFKNVKDYMEEQEWKSIHSFVLTEMKRTENLNRQIEEKSPPKKKTKTDFDLFQFTDTDDDKSVEEDLVLEEFNCYCSEKRPSKDQRDEFDIFHYWKTNKSRYPLLSVLATKYLCIKSSQADVERDNSFLENMITNKRTRLEPSLVSKMLFIRNNIVNFKKYFN